MKPPRRPHCLRHHQPRSKHGLKRALRYSVALQRGHKQNPGVLDRPGGLASTLPQTASRQPQRSATPTSGPPGTIV